MKWPTTTSSQANKRIMLSKTEVSGAKAFGVSFNFFACIMGLECWALSSLCKFHLSDMDNVLLHRRLLLGGVDDDNCTIVLDGKFRVAG